MGMGRKRCSQCRGYFPHSDFSRNKATVDGLDTLCRSCRSEYNRNYREVNPSYNRDYCTKNKRNCVYLIIENKQIMYIGSTINDLSYRVSSHLNGYTSIRNYMLKNTWTEIKYIHIDDDIEEHELRAIEQIFIDEMCPMLNQNIASNFDNISEDRMEYISELAYEKLEYYEKYSKTYKINYSNMEA